MTKTKTKIARAADVGFGWTKFSTSMLDEAYGLSALSFPSFPAPADGHITTSSDGLLQKLHVITVEVDGIPYLVGPDSISASRGEQTRTETNAFFTSRQYKALYLGALAYMNLPTNEDTIHMLGAGLPLPVWRDKAMRAAVKESLTGTFKVPVPDTNKTRTINVESVQLWPQVLGALVSIANQDGDLETVASQTNLSIDVGYGTMLWMVTSAGLKPEDSRSDGTNGGVSRMLKAVARSIDSSLVNDPRTLDSIDQALRIGRPLIIDGKEVDIEPCRVRAREAASEYLNALVESITTHKNIENIFLSGGGAHLYASLVQERFPSRKIRMQTEEPQFANVKGYQHMAEQLIGL